MNDWLMALRRRFRHFREDGDLKDELRVHAEMLAEDHLAGGVAPAEAHRRARLQLRDPQLVVEDIRKREFATVLESYYCDFTVGVRALRKSPAFCFTAILTLALGIGANTAVFTVLYGLLLRSLPAPDAHRLARLSLISTLQKATSRNFIPYRMLQEFRGHQRSFTDISAWIGTAVGMEDADGAFRFQITDLVSGNAFEVLGIKPYMGRLIEPADDIHGVPPTGWPVVISYGVWKDRFGADPHIVGKAIKLSGAIATVIGVVPPDFHGLVPGSDSKLYLPIRFLTGVLRPGEDLDAPGSLVGCLAMGRLRAGISIDQANAEVTVYRKQLLDLVPPRYQHLPFYQKATFRVESARTGFLSYFGKMYAQPLYLMQGLVAVVLLLCCVNVGGLMMSKVYARHHEFAVRIAIGAARWRLVRQFLTESFVLTSAGAALGTAVAWYGNDFLLQFFRTPMVGQWMSVHPEVSILWVNALCALLATVAFGVWSALRAGSTDPGALLNARTAGARRHTAGRAFIPIQVALSVALVSVAALLSQSLVRLRGEHTGFDLRNVTIQTAPFNLLPQKGDAKLDLYQRMVDRMEQMPGIESAAVTWTTPMTGYQATARFQPLTGTNTAEDSEMAYNDVGPGYSARWIPEFWRLESSRRASGKRMFAS